MHGHNNLEEEKYYFGDTIQAKYIQKSIQIDMYTYSQSTS